jgi:hypothetical protein
MRCMERAIRGRMEQLRWRARSLIRSGACRVRCENDGWRRVEPVEFRHAIASSFRPFLCDVETWKCRPETPAQARTALRLHRRRARLAVSMPAWYRACADAGQGEIAFPLIPRCWIEVVTDSARSAAIALIRFPHSKSSVVCRGHPAVERFQLTLGFSHPLVCGGASNGLTSVGRASHVRERPPAVNGWKARGCCCLVTSDAVVVIGYCTRTTRRQWRRRWSTSRRNVLFHK